MKQFIVLFSIIIMTKLSVFAQSAGTGSSYLSSVSTVTIEKNVICQGGKIQPPDYQSFQYSEIGMKKEVLDQQNYTSKTKRAYVVFDLEPLKAINKIQVTKAKVIFSSTSLIYGAPSYTSKLTHLATLGDNYEANYNSISASGELHKGLQSNALEFESIKIKDAINNSLPNGKLIIGVLSDSETQENSWSSFSITISVEYTYQLSSVNIVVRNYLDGENGGNVGVGIYPNPPVSYSSPYTAYAYEYQKLNITAYDNQLINGNAWIFNDTEGPALKSQWRKTTIYAGSSKLSDKQAFTTEPLQKVDDGFVFEAILRKDLHTSSGVLTQNETWFRNITLQGNVTVPSGTKLILLQGITVNLNGYSLISGGGIIEQQGAAIVGLSANISMKKLFFWDIA